MKTFRIICACAFVIALAFLVYYIVDARREIVIPPEAIREPIIREEPVHVVQDNVQPAYEEHAVVDNYDMYVAGDDTDISEPFVLSGFDFVPRELLPRIVELRAQYGNEDIVGYISIPGTNISYPVAQTGNNVYYLYHDLHHNRTAAGSIFADYWSDLGALADDNTIIFGHNMRNGSKFHNLRHFHNEDFFRRHTYILLDTPYQETVWDVFSFFHTTTDFCYLTPNFPTREMFYEFIMYLQSQSAFETDIVLSEDDQILILSTCGVRGGINRYILIGRLRR